MIADLHCHTRLSDGSMSIDDIIFYARRAGLSFLSITDHDTMDGVTRGMVLGKRYGIRVLPGVELSCLDYLQHREVHLLCYFPTSPNRLLGMMNKTLESRTTTGKEMIAKLTRFYPITEEHISRYTSGSKAIYPAHLMQPLMDLGYCGESHGELYTKLFHPETGICYIKPELPDIRDALELIHEAGGLSVLAHPCISDAIPLLEDLTGRGLLDGVEIYHPSASPKDTRILSDMAQEYGLIATGGSDFHGYLAKYPHPLATCVVQDDDIEALFRLKKHLAGKS